MKRPADPRLAPLFSRFSCRRFGKVPVDPADRAALREVLRWSPSAGNAQPWIFVEVASPPVKAELAAAALGQRFVAEAPLVYAICADPAAAERAYGERGRSLYVLQDTAAAAMSLLAAAACLGYGACWVGAFDERRVAASLQLEKGLRPVALVPVGRPAERDKGPERKPLEQVLRVLE